MKSLIIFPNPSHFCSNCALIKNHRSRNSMGTYIRSIFQARSIGATFGAIRSQNRFEKRCFWSETFFRCARVTVTAAEKKQAFWGEYFCWGSLLANRMKPDYSAILTVYKMIKSKFCGICLRISSIFLAFCPETSSRKLPPSRPPLKKDTKPEICLVGTVALPEVLWCS